MKLNSLITILTVCVLAACSEGVPIMDGMDPVTLDYDCDNTFLWDVTDNPGESGPFPVGVKTVFLGQGDRLKTEIWYPSFRGIDHLYSKNTYDLRQFLPDADAALIPDGVLDQECDCYRDAPINFLRGKFPVIVQVHGTAAFRTASLTQAVHWASRGFVVVSTDNPFINLKDAKSNPFGIINATQAQDTVDLITALQQGDEPLQWLSWVLDMRRVGLVGHSAGGSAIALLGDVPGVRTIVPLASSGVAPGEFLDSALIMGGALDSIVPFFAQQDGFLSSPAPKRLVGIEQAGHLAFTELCAVGADAGGVIPLVEQFGVEVPDLFKRLGTDGCGEAFLSPEQGFDLVNYATTGAFEETLQCKASSAQALSKIPQIFDQAALTLEEL